MLTDVLTDSELQKRKKIINISDPRHTFLCCLNFPSERRFSSPTSHFLSVVIWTQKEEQGLFWHNKLISEQCHSWLHVTAQNFLVIDKMWLQRVTHDKLITYRRFYSRMLPWNADNAICNQKPWLQQWSRADASKQQTSRPPFTGPSVSQRSLQESDWLESLVKEAPWVENKSSLFVSKSIILTHNLCQSENHQLVHDKLH